MPFSQRYGYVKPEKILIREQMEGAVLNAVVNCSVDFCNPIICGPHDLYNGMLREFKQHYLNLQYRDFNRAPGPFEYINREEITWYKRLDVIEWSISYHREKIERLWTQKDISEYEYKEYAQALNLFIEKLNSEFERLNYAYRIIDDVFVETTSSSELSTIQETLNEADTNVVTHLEESLRLLSPRNQELSTRNAIKEAISAVEVAARKVTNTKTLDDAFKKLKGVIHPMIKMSMENLYHYTNQKDTGIRHGWMEQANEPSINEAILYS